MVRIRQLVMCGFVEATRVCFLPILCFFVETNAAHAQRFVEIKAEIEQFAYPWEGHHSNQNDYSFSVVCVVGTNTWRMEPSLTESGGNQFFFDGTNVYNNIIAAKPLGLGDKIKKPIAKTNLPGAKTNSSVHVRTSPGGFPLADSRANICWLAFCSGTYLKREGRIVPQPVVFSFVNSPDGFAYNDKTETFEDEFGLPRTINLYASEQLFEGSVLRGVFEGKRDVELWKRGSTGFKWDYPDGTLKFHYEVTEATNFLGWHFPLAFEFFLTDRATNGTISPRCGGKGRVTSIRTSGKPQSVMTRQPVVDWRFREPDKNVFALIYPSTNNVVAPTNDAVLQQKLIEKAKEAVKPPSRKRSKARPIILSMLVLTAVIPIALIPLYKTKQKAKKTK